VALRACSVGGSATQTTTCMPLVKKWVRTSARGNCRTVVMLVGVTTTVRQIQHCLHAHAPLQGPTVISLGLNITVNGALIVLKIQTQRTWKVVQLQPQLQPYDISLAGSNAGLFKQPQDCRLSIAAIPPSPVSELYTLRLCCNLKCRMPSVTGHPTRQHRIQIT
jgi:hypothetical protein